MSQKLRIGLLVDGYSVPAWVSLVLERITRGNYAEIALVVVNDLEPEDPEFRLKPYRSGQRLFRALTGRWLRYARKQLMERKPVGNDPRRLVDVKPLLANIPVMRVKPRQENYVDRFKEEDVGRIRHDELDVLVRFGFRVLSGDILSAARHGVWSYHHGDNRRNRGGPPGFWETMESWAETGSLLQVLSEDLDGGTVLYRSWSCTNRTSVSHNNSQRYWTAASFLPRALERLYLLDEDAFEKEISRWNDDFEFYSERLYTGPTNSELASLVWRKLVQKLKSRLRYTFWRDQWILLYAFADDVPASLRKYRQYVPPKDRFWADPFAVHRDGQYYVYVEELVYEENFGRIAVFTIDEETGPGKPTTVLSEPHHLSYPFIFELDGVLYMLAEAYEARTVPLYRCERFPDKWVFERNLLEDIAAVDPTLYLHDGTWYLFVNMAENPGSSEWDELFLFMTDEPLRGEWRPHPLNPVVSDVRTARPAGRLVRRNGRLYRPSQDCSHHYGYALNLNRVLTLSPTAYEETLGSKILPNWDPHIKSVHTFSTSGRLTVMDAQLRRARYW